MNDFSNIFLEHSKSDSNKNMGKNHVLINKLYGIEQDCPRTYND